MQLIQAARENIRSLLEQCNVPYKVIPFDHDLYQQCIDDGNRRGYPMDSDRLLKYLPVGVVYAAAACGHISHRPTQVWVALYTTCATIIDDVPENHLSELPDIYQFNDRFIRRQPQMNEILDMFADIICRAPDLYQSVASQLITTSTLNFVTANLIEHETKSMEILSAAEQYPTYQRTLSGVAEAYGFMVFSREIPLNHYIQAIPEMTAFISNVNDVISFYKEEKIGDPTNQISTLAARANKSKLETLTELTETTIGLYKRIVSILQGSPKACEEFKRYTAGYVYFHSSLPRYRMDELNL